MRLSILLLFLFNICNIVYAQHEHKTQTADSTKKSIPAEVHAQIGNAHVMMHYYSPAVRNRTIWGGLVTYEEVWVTGAHRATNIETDHALVFGNAVLPPGKYAVFTIPGKKSWQFIINKKWDQHLADEYDAKEDVLRLTVKPKKDKHFERLTYAIREVNAQKGILTMNWEKLKIEVPFFVR
jgi:hypothetical protein